MRLSRRDLLGLLIAAGAAVASVVVWTYGRVDIGLTLREDSGRVYVDQVIPDGNAARSGFHSGWRLIELTTTDGAELRRGASLGDELSGAEIPPDPMPWEMLGSVGQELYSLDATHRPPAEAVDSARITRAIAGEVQTEEGWVYLFAAIDRSHLELLLRQSIWMVAFGLVLGAGVWRLLAHGIGGQTGRELAVLAGVAAATPLLLAPVIQVGTGIGIVAGYLVPAAVTLILGVSLAARNVYPKWAQAGVAAAFVAAALAVTLVIRHMTDPGFEGGDRLGILVVIGAIAAAPALMAASGGSGLRERAGQLSVALVPAAGLSAIAPSTPQPVLPAVLLAGLVGTLALPVDRAWGFIRRRWDAVRPSQAAVVGAEPEVAAWRDRLTLVLLAGVGFVGLMQSNNLLTILGAGLAAAVGLLLRRGFLGPSWTDAAVPLAAAVGVPVMAMWIGGWYYGGATSPSIVPTALAALSVAHVLASRHSDPRLRSRLFLASGGLVALIILLALMGLSASVVLVGVVPLIPGLPAAFAEERGETRAVTSRLETLAVALTPGAAATVLVPSTGGLLLAAWLVAVGVWRRFTLAPLIGLAQRTQLQRDLAVAAAETERARLAADLHDDALQQLTMLVRKLDEAGQAEAATEAREVATKLRSIVGDLRLPILDDLGAGAALEWLVERVEPLAGGPVTLDRSDQARPPANVELAVFRVAQEALTNAIKHGKPPIAVHYDVRADGRVTLAIDDAGPGIGAAEAEEAPHQGHFGLANMQQRAEQIGALLDVRRWPAGGTRVAFEWRPQ